MHTKLLRSFCWFGKISAKLADRRLCLTLLVVPIAVESLRVAGEHSTSSHLFNCIDTMEYPSSPCFIDDHPIIHREAVSDIDTNGEISECVLIKKDRVPKLIKEGIIDHALVVVAFKLFDL